jgi:hypothetical protein
MDLEKRARRQSLRIIISEAIMVIAVAATVVVLAMVVSGYWLNSDFKVERQGMLQINSVPTGAKVSVDGDAPWFQRTNTSKVLSGGEHEVVLSKDGYDTWSKTVNVKEGLLYRLNYPYLFLKERYKESVYDTTTATFATVSPNHKLMLLANNTTKWELVDLDSDQIKPSVVDVSKVSSIASPLSETEVGLFKGEILSAEWDGANEHVLFKVRMEDGIKWVLLDVKNVSKSVNLTREFAAEFNTVDIFDYSADNLLVTRGGNLHRIDVNSRQISAILISDIVNFDYYESEIVYATKDSVFFRRLSSDEPTLVTATSDKTQVLISKFYDEKYIYIIEGINVSIFKKESLEKAASFKLGFIPEAVKAGYGGEFIIMTAGDKIATLDMEAMQVREWATGSVDYGWLNQYMVYAVKDGELSAYDFDGFNHRVLAANVSHRFPATITSEKWLYYFSDDELIREWLIAR